MKVCEHGIYSQLLYTVPPWPCHEQNGSVSKKNTSSCEPLMVLSEAGACPNFSLSRHALSVGSRGPRPSGSSLQKPGEAAQRRGAEQQRWRE